MFRNRKKDALSYASYTVTLRNRKKGCAQLYIVYCHTPQQKRGCTQSRIVYCHTPKQKRGHAQLRTIVMVKASGHIAQSRMLRFVNGHTLQEKGGYAQSRTVYSNALQPIIIIMMMNSVAYCLRSYSPDIPPTNTNHITQIKSHTINSASLKIGAEANENPKYPFKCLMNFKCFCTLVL